MDKYYVNAIYDTITDAMYDAMVEEYGDPRGEYDPTDDVDRVMARESTIKTIIEDFLTDIFNGQYGR